MAAKSLDEKANETWRKIPPELQKKLQGEFKAPDYINKPRKIKGIIFPATETFPVARVSGLTRKPRFYINNLIEEEFLASLKYKGRRLVPWYELCRLLDMPVKSKYYTAAQITKNYGWTEATINAIVDLGVLEMDGRKIRGSGLLDAYLKVFGMTEHWSREIPPEKWTGYTYKGKPLVQPIFDEAAIFISGSTRYADSPAVKKKFSRLKAKNYCCIEFIAPDSLAVIYVGLREETSDTVQVSFMEAFRVYANMLDAHAKFLHYKSPQGTIGGIRTSRPDALREFNGNHGIQIKISNNGSGELNLHERGLGIVSGAVDFLKLHGKRQSKILALADDNPFTILLYAAIKDAYPKPF